MVEITTRGKVVVEIIERILEQNVRARAQARLFVGVDSEASCNAIKTTLSAKSMALTRIDPTLEDRCELLPQPIRRARGAAIDAYAP